MGSWPHKKKGSPIISFMLSISFSGVKIIDRKYIEDDEDDDTRQQQATYHHTHISTHISFPQGLYFCVFLGCMRASSGFL